MSLAATLDDYRRDPSPRAKSACVAALTEAIVFVCSPTDPTLERTGHEPAFQLACTANRRLVMAEVPETGSRLLFVFSSRAAADAWSSRVRGFAAEPVDGPAAAAIAARADAGIAVDPVDLALVIAKEEFLFGQCGLRRLADAGLVETLDRWIEDDSAFALAQARTAFRDAVLFILVAAPPSRSAPGWLKPRLELAADEALLSVCGREILATVTDGGPMINANTSRAMVEAWGAHDPRFICLAVDAPALARAAMMAGADLGIMVGERKSLALGPEELAAEWPTRSIGSDDF